MNLIIDNNTLKKYIPNQFETIDDEDTLFDKIEPSLVTAELWIEKFIAPLDVNYDEDTTNLLCQICALYAFEIEIPSLDLVLTPNGFGIVSNQNIAPASSERVTRLIKSIKEKRNRTIDRVLTMLNENSDWLASKQAEIWHQSLFQFLWQITTIRNTVTSDDAFNDYIKLMPTIINIENKFAEHVLSFPLLDKLRYFMHTNELTNQEIILANKVYNSTISLFNCDKNLFAAHFSHFCSQIADYLKSNINDFGDWKNSDAASKWIDPKFFVNEKKNHGYFF